MPSVRPLDMQHLMNQTQEISIKRQHDIERANQNQNIFAKELEKTYDKERDKVIKSEKSENIHLDERNSNAKNNMTYSKNKKENEKKDDNGDNNDIIIDGHIDVIV